MSKHVRGVSKTETWTVVILTVAGACGFLIAFIAALTLPNVGHSLHIIVPIITGAASVLALVLSYSGTHTFAQRANEYVEEIELVKKDRDEQASRWHSQVEGLTEVRDRLEGLVRVSDKELQLAHGLSVNLAKDLGKLIVRTLELATDFCDSKALPSGSESNGKRLVLDDDQVGKFRRAQIIWAIRTQQLWDKVDLTLPGAETKPVFDLISLLNEHTRPDVVMDVVDEMIKRQQLPEDPDNPQPWEAAFQHFGVQGERVMTAKRLFADRIKGSLTKIKADSNGRIAVPEAGWYDWYQMIMAVDQFLSSEKGKQVLLSVQVDRQIKYRFSEADQDMEALSNMFGQNFLASDVRRAMPVEPDLQVVCQMTYLIFLLLEDYPRLLPHFKVVKADEGGEKLILQRVNNAQANALLALLWHNKNE